MSKRTLGKVSVALVIAVAEVIWESSKKCGNRGGASPVPGRVP
jgi:hypothetical protein